MKIISKLNESFLKPMEEYRRWVFEPRIQSAIHGILEPQKEKLLHGENGSSEKYLGGMDHENHDGLPPDFVGINLNSQILKLHLGQFDGDFIREAQKKSESLDDDLQDLLGAKLCALKMFYPTGGYIDWHTNWDSPGYNVIFTYSQNGNGHWRHIDPTGATSVKPRWDKMVHVDDTPGWHCKAGYFGKKDETDRILWHSAYTREPRLTLSYIVYDKALWENLVDELAEG